MNTISWVRHTHRWIAIAFTSCVIANFIAMAWGPPPVWITYTPLLPLALLMLTGLTLFARSYLPRGVPRPTHRGGPNV